MKTRDSKSGRTLITRRLLSILLLAGLAFCGFYALKIGYSFYRWDVGNWAYHYWTAENPDDDVPNHQKHLIFVMVDHYEHGGPREKERGTKENNIWCDQFMEISNRHQDDYGNNFRYTWFYPFDHHNDEIMERLSQMAYEGYGEVELHWHLGSKSGVNRENFAGRLSEAIDWFQSYGSLITAKDSKTAFAYIAGVWDLDAGRGGKETHGITNQIQQLVDQGCYADFTFSTIGSPAQPSTVNSIYYVTDDPDQPKSYNTGQHSTVGHSNEDQLLIFQGPSALAWNGDIEYGAIENDPRFEPGRISKWIDANIHVHGRPEWIFVKVYSHGAQSKDVVVAHDMDWMLTSLREQCSDLGIKLHFMTAREAFNVVKSAEHGHQGNPEDYRDFQIGKYKNMVTPLESSPSEKDD